MKNRPQVDPEFKALMPPLTDEEYNQLEQNIVTRRKCDDPILLWNDTIIDGFNRFCICVTHGIEFKVEEVEFASREEAKIWIIENQLGRRNLNAAQRIELALCKEEVLRAKAKENLSKGGGDRKSPSPKTTKPVEEPIDVQKALAKEANVSHGTLNNYMQIKSSGKPELLEKVQSGELKIGTAHRMLMPQIRKQLDEADKMVAYIKEHMPLISEEQKHHVQELLDQLAEQVKGYSWIKS